MRERELEDFYQLNSSYYLKIQERPPKSNLIDFLFYFFVLILVVLGIKLTIFDYNFFKSISEGNYYYNILFFPPRGNIFTSDGKVIAQNIPSFDLVIDLVLMRKDKNLFNQTIEFLEKVEIVPNVITKEKIEEELTKKNQILIRNIDQATGIVIKNRDLPSLIVVDSFQRFYPYGEVFSHLLGYPSFEKNLRGVSGLERTYDDYLVGEIGFKKYLRDARGIILKEVEKKEALEGKNLITTIDFKLQSLVFEKMKENLEKLNLKKAAALFVDDQGKILAMASFPSFDNNIFTKVILSKEEKEKIKKILEDKNSVLLNRVISGLYAPGSIVKPVVAIAGLENKKITPQEEIYSPGYLRVQNPYTKEVFLFKDWKVHGWTNLFKAIRDSVNVYFYTLGERIGYETLMNYYEKLDFTKLSNIDIFGEKEGILKRKEKYFLGDIYNISIGQGEIAITPLRMALLAQALGLNKILKPYLVEKIIDSNGKVVFENKPQVIKENIFQQEELRIVQKAMNEMATFGFGGLFKDLPLKVAGKTGTPEVGNNVFNGIFIGYFPYEKPKYFFVMLVEEAPLFSITASRILHDILKDGIEMGIFKDL